MPETTSLMTVPSILEDMLAESPESVCKLVDLDFVAVGGGALKQTTGQKLHEQQINLLNHFGATELGALAPIFRPGEDYDWRYLRLRQDLGIHLEPAGKTDRGASLVRLIGHPFGWKSSWELKDRLIIRPDSPRPELRILGRTDDLLVLATGEKVYPTPMESAIVESEQIETAVMFGDGRFQVGILIEPTKEAKSLGREHLLALIWDTISGANEQADKHAQVSSTSAILLKLDERLIPRSDKGSVQRKEVYATFAADIENVYQSLDNDSNTIQRLQPSWQDVHEDVRKIVSFCTGREKVQHEWADTADFIEQGLDSLGIVRLRRLLQAYLKHEANSDNRPSSLPADFVYLHPSIEQIVSYLTKASRPMDVTFLQNRSDTMLKLWQDHLPFEALKDGAVGRPVHKMVMVTGSTGYLGTQVVAELARTDDVAKIFCLLRSNKVQREACNAHTLLQRRQREAFTRQGILLRPGEWEKIEALEWSPGEERLGLQGLQYDELVHQVTHVFHAAWPMDFKRRLESFAPHFKALADLLKLLREAHSTRPHMKPRLVFTSSIAVARHYPRSSGMTTFVPESFLQDPSFTLPMGYAEGKWVCERMLQSAMLSWDGEMELSVVRIGQLSAADDTGRWNDKEHVPMMLNASLGLGRLPDIAGVSF